MWCLTKKVWSRNKQKDIVIRHTFHMLCCQNSRILSQKNNSKYNLHVLCSEQTLSHLLKQLGKVLTHNTNQLNPALNPSCNSPSSISKLITAESCPKLNLNSLKALEHTRLPSHPRRLPPHWLVELLLPYPCTNTRTHLCTDLCSISKAKLTKVFMCNRR